MPLEVKAQPHIHIDVFLCSIQQDMVGNPLNQVSWNIYGSISVLGYLACLKERAGLYAAIN